MPFLPTAPTLPNTLQGSWKGCDCLATAEINSAIVGDTNLYDNGKTWLDEQQQLIDVLSDEQPFCIHGASPRGDRIPRGYCNCGDDEKTLTYSEAKSTTSPYNACPYTTDNGPTVTFQAASTMTTRSTPSASPIVTCSEPRDRWFSSTDGYDFASQFCNRGEGEVLMPRPASGFASAYEQSFNVDKDPLVSIFAYLDDSCQTQGITHLNGEECAMALDSIMHDCKLFHKRYCGKKTYLPVSQAIRTQKRRRWEVRCRLVASGSALWLSRGRVVKTRLIWEHAYPTLEGNRADSWLD